MSGRRSSIEQCYQIYNEIEDIGKSIKASKRRARWTFCFGEEGNQKEVILIHSLVSGKKTIFYDNRDIHQSSEGIHHNFTHTWYDEKHLLRLDIYPTGNGKGSMYELLIDGLAFHQHPVFSESAIRRKSSPQKVETKSSTKRSSTSTSTKRSKEKGSDKTRSSKVIAPPPDLLSMDDFDDPISQNSDANKGKSGNDIFDPFPQDPFANPTNSQSKPFDFSDMQDSLNNETVQNNFQVMDFSAPNKGTDNNKPTLYDTSSFQAFPNNSFPPFSNTSTQDLPKERIQQNEQDEDDFEPFSQAGDKPADKIEKFTAGLVNLDNILDDANQKKKEGNIEGFGNNFIQSNATDHRSLDSIKASQEKLSQNEKKSAFLVREPVYPQAPSFQQNQMNNSFGNPTMPPGPSNTFQNNNNFNATVGSFPSNIEPPVPKSGPMSSGYQVGINNMANMNNLNRNNFANQFQGMGYGINMGMSNIDPQMGLMSQTNYPPSTMMTSGNNNVSTGQQNTNLFSQTAPAPSSKNNQAFDHFGF